MIDLDVLVGLGARFVPHDFVTTLTPQLARALLEGNVANRNLRQSKINELTGAIRRGEWVYNGDAIRISVDSSGRWKLLDSQHRCHAVVRTGITIETLMVIVPDGAQETIDVGLKRTAGDFLHMRGEKHSNSLGAATRLLWAWTQDGVPSMQNRTLVPTIREGMALLEAHPGLRDSLVAAAGNPLAALGFGAAHHYIFSLRDAEDAAVFMELFRTGRDLKEGNPIHTLRERLIKDRATASGQLHARVKSAFFIKSWNCWLAGVPLRRLQFRPGGGRPDVFPAVDGLDYNDYRIATYEENDATLR